MCNPTESESGQLLTIQPCGWYIKLLSEKSQLEGRCAGMEDGIIINKATIANQSELIEKLLAENEALKQERDAFKAQLSQYLYAVQHVTEEGNTTRSYSTSNGWAMVHEDRLADLEVAEEQRDKLLKVREAAHRWTEYDGTEATLPEINETVVAKLVDGGLQVVTRAHDYWISESIEQQAEIGDRWMPWPEGGE